MPTYRPGDRIRMVHTIDSYGTITGDVFQSPVDGGDRQNVRWDRTGVECAWDPIFYRPAESSFDADPDEEIRSGRMVSRKTDRVVARILGNGLCLLSAS